MKRLAVVILGAVVLGGCVETSRTTRLSASGSGLRATPNGGPRMSPGIHIDASTGKTLRPFASSEHRFKPVDLPGVWEQDYASMKEKERLDKQRAERRREGER